MPKINGPDCYCKKRDVLRQREMTEACGFCIQELMQNTKRDAGNFVCSAKFGLPDEKGDHSVALL
jgi:hypothetical protein